MAIARAQYSIKDLNDIVAQASPPVNPVPGLLWRNTSVTPNELLAWAGNGTQTDRRYTASKSGAAVAIPDLSDDHTLGVTVRTVAIQAGGGTPSPSNIRAISGKSSVMVLWRGKNLFDPALNGATLNGVTISYDPATQEIMLNGTCTTDNTIFNLSNAPRQMNAAHIYSTRYVSGSFSPVGFNSIQMFHTQGQSGCYIPTAADPLRIAPIDGARSYTGMNIRVDAGSVFANFKFKTQVELGTTATEWEPYVAQAYTLTPDAPTYGLSEAQDHIGTDGFVAHYTMLLTLTGNEAFNDGSDLGSVVRVGLPGIIAGTPGDTPSICSHFQHLYSYASDTVHYYVTGDALILYIPKSLLSSYNLAGAKAWIKAQNETAHTPIQILYQRANPVYAAVAPVAIAGMDGINTVTSDGASVTVSYTGSGWVALGAVQRVAVESVSITPEQGLRVATVLTSPDGTKQASTYFNARGTKYGLFRTSDGRMVAGAYLDNAGAIYEVVSGLKTPDVDNVSLLMQAINGPHGVTTGGLSIKGNDLTLGGFYGEYVDGKRDYNPSSPTLDGVVFYSAGDLELRNNCPDGGDTYNGTYLRLAGGKLYSRTGITTTSDERAKHDIAPMDAAKATEFLMALSPVSYRLNSIPEELHYGFIAQAFKAAMDSVEIPEDFAGYDGSNADHLGLCYTELIAVLAIALQHHQREIEALKADCDALQATAENQTAEIQALRDDRDAQTQRLDDLEARLEQLIPNP